MKVKYIFAPLSILFLASCSGTYHKPVKSLVTPVLTSRAEFSNLRFLGEGESKTLVVYSGMDSDLKFALQNIIPADWTFKYSPNVSKALLSNVSWDAGQQWLYVLDSAMRANSLFANINWNKKQVDIEMVDKLARPQPVKSIQPLALPKATHKAESNTQPRVINSKPRNPFAAPDKPPIVTNNPHVISGAAKSAGLLTGQAKPLAGIVTPTIPKVTTASVITATSKPLAVKPFTPGHMTVPVMKNWKIDSGVTLREGILQWANSESCSGGHWTLLWETPVNYRVGAALHFSGDFKNALNGVFELYRNAQKPLYAITNTPQCLLRVTSK